MTEGLYRTYTPGEGSSSRNTLVIQMPNDSVIITRSLFDRLVNAERENEEFRNKINALKRYFTSGNDVPIERATIKASDFWAIVSP